MKRREFIATTAATALSAAAFGRAGAGAAAENEACGLTYPSPSEAMQAPRETLAYVPAIRVGTGHEGPDYLATVDVDPDSKTYSRVIHRLPMPHVGDELHHYGWNACSSCHEGPHARRYLVLPGLRSGRIHIVDTAQQDQPKLHHVIEPEEVARKTNLSAPHTVHCRADGSIMISMLGDAEGNAPGGFLLLDQDFRIVGRWESDVEGMDYNYDFWYQVRHDTMVSSEWAAPRTFVGGFDLKDVQAGKYGRRLLFWDWSRKRVRQSVDLGEEGLIPLEVRFHHNPDSSHGFVGAALSSAVWHWFKQGDQWKAEKVIQVEPAEIEGWPFPVPGLVTDLLLSLDDRFLYFSNWLHGDVRQYDVSDPLRPKLTGRVWLGGLAGEGAPSRNRELGGHPLTGGPQMLQLSLDGRRLYLTNSLFSSWDDQFYPDIVKKGSYMVQIDCDTERGGMKVNEDFFVDFGREPDGPVRAHEIRFPDGDSTSDIWV